MSSNLRISVYITSYNQKAFLKVAIESVLNQTMLPYEIIIVDDCSDDGSQDLILDYAKAYSIIRYSFHTTNKGVAQVRRTALNMVQGDYVTYVDGDDVYLPRKLEIESQIIVNQSCEIAFSNNLYVLENDLDNIQWIWTSMPINFNSHKSVFIKTIGRFFPRNSLFRMELVNFEFLKKVGFQDPSLELYEDYDLRIRLAEFGKFGFSLEPTSKIRISSQGLSKLPREKHYEAFKYIFNKYKMKVESLDSTDKDLLQQRFDDLLGKVNTKRKSTDLSIFFDKVLKKAKKL